MDKKQIKREVDRLTKRVERVLAKGATLTTGGTYVNEDGELYGRKEVCLMTAISHGHKYLRVDEESRRENYGDVAERVLGLTKREGADLEQGFMYGFGDSEWHRIGNNIANRFRKRGLMK